MLKYYFVFICVTAFLFCLSTKCISGDVAPKDQVDVSGKEEKHVLPKALPEVQMERSETQMERPAEIQRYSEPQSQSVFPGEKQNRIDIDPPVMKEGD
jgi:hypothetical protein